MDKQVYDLAIIGGGPAGYHGAVYAGKRGIRTLLFEAEHLGGVCLNSGCIPTKCLLNTAKLYYKAKVSGDYAVNVQATGIDQAQAVDHAQKVIKQLVNGIKGSLKGAGVTTVLSRATITSAANGVFTVTDGEKQYQAARVMIAAGSKAIIPPLMGVEAGLESGMILTNKEVLQLQQAPKSMLIVGGGAIGLEMADYYNQCGTQVTVVEAMEQIGGRLDAEVAQALMLALENKGIQFLLGARVYAVRTNSVCIISKEGESRIIPAEKVLLSVGRRPYVDGLGLEQVGVIVERGRVSVGEDFTAGVPGLYFVGDCNGRSMLAHTAYAEAEAVVNGILGEPATLNYDFIPSGIYTCPEVAAVGLDSASAQARGLDTVCVKLPFQYSGRYVAENTNGTGFIKAVAQRGTGRLLGVQCMGDYAIEFITAAEILMQQNIPVTVAQHVVFPHPTNCEIIKDALAELARMV